LNGLFAIDDTKDADSGKSEDSQPISKDQQSWIKGELAEIDADVDKFFAWLGCQTFGEITVDQLPKIENMIAKKKES